MGHFIKLIVSVKIAPNTIFKKDVYSVAALQAPRWNGVLELSLIGELLSTPILIIIAMGERKKTQLTTTITRSYYKTYA